MNVQREYYENDSFWDENRFGERDRKRIARTAETIPADVLSILDVGCGNGMFLHYLESTGRFKRLLAVDRSMAALHYVKTARSCAAVEKLPLKDGEFDLVASLEVLEHLPVNTFVSALEELARVSRRYVLVSVPNEESLRYAMVECPSCLTRFNQNYHVRTFNRDSIADLFADLNFSCRALVPLATRTDPVIPKILRREISKRGLRHPTVCPLCGYHLSVSHRVKRSVEKGTECGRHKLLGELFKRVWPRTVKYSWIVALYESQRAP